jgi:hypothetical protein
MHQVNRVVTTLVEMESEKIDAVQIATKGPLSWAARRDH